MAFDKSTRSYWCDDCGKEMISDWSQCGDGRHVLVCSAECGFYHEFISTGKPVLATSDEVEEFCTESEELYDAKMCPECPAEMCRITDGVRSGWTCSGCSYSEKDPCPSNLPT